MGSSQSRSFCPPSNGERSRGKNAISAGANGDNPYYEDDDDSGRHCCFLGNDVTKSIRNLTNGRNNDPMGSPLPGTPDHQRRRRQQVQEALRRDEPVFSSKYNGLEKEVTSSTDSLLEFNDGNVDGLLQNGRSRAMVYEGPDCERLLNEKYQLMEVLGVGSTSTVHRCMCKANKEHFACKIIDCQLIEDRFHGMMDQFQTEIEALRQLQHPSIIRLYDVFMTGDKIYIVMELMEGGELFDYVVEKGTLTEEEAALIVRKVTSALVYMHSKNICHRDLKPENLLLKQKPRSPKDNVDVKVIDFGLSKAMEEPVARTFLGTRGYLAPEMLQRRDYTKGVDTWALGVIVFVLLCGCLPFDDDSSTVPSDDLVRTRFSLRFPRWAKNLSPSAKDLLNHLLDVNPRTRYTAEQALHHPWVRGETAPKDNLLLSPGKIKMSPNIVHARAAANRAGATGARKGSGMSGRTPPTPQPQIVRKTSI